MANANLLQATLAQFDIELTLNIAVNQLVNDSRKVQNGDVFCAVIGSQADGRKFIANAVENGAACIISECIHPQQHGRTTQLQKANGELITVVHFYQLNKQLYQLASEFYGHPLQQLTTVGVTGTNGKSSSCWLIASLLDAYQPSAIIGTLGFGKLGKLTELVNTTPGPAELVQCAAQIKADNNKLVALEVSSHALEQHRIEAQSIDIAVFTNLSRDHLDYHGSMENYAAAKRSLFTNKPQIAVLNGDSAICQTWLETWPSEQTVWLYGLGENITSHSHFVTAKQIKHTPQGIEFQLVSHLGDCPIQAPLLGDFNVSNLLAACSVALIQGMPLAELTHAAQNITPVPGRMEQFRADNKAITVVDYAHTPDGLEQALLACRRHLTGKLFLVFGCGGDRDKGKRPEMGKIAEKYADHIVITNDNPRREAAEFIAQDILSGISARERVTVMLDRAQAVKHTINKAANSDMVLLAGKGHENYMIIGERKVDYFERALVQQLYQQGDQP